MSPRTMVVALAIGAWAVVGLAEGNSRPLPRFRTVVVCDSFPGGYQVAVADIHHLAYQREGMAVFIRDIAQVQQGNKGAGIGLLRVEIV